MGVVYNPAANKCFYAELNEGAYLNNRLIQPSNAEKLSDCDSTCKADRDRADAAAAAEVKKIADAKAKIEAKELADK